MKKVLLTLSLVTLLVFTGCTETTNSDSVLQQQTEQSMQEMNRQIGMPAIINFQERKLAKLIFELRDREDFLTNTYFINLEGDLVFFCRSIGYGLPYSVQYTNPQKRSGNYESSLALPQADPNGLFMPEGLSATWVMCLDKNNEARPVYVEPTIIVSPVALDVTSSK
jgi:hypothetical protein